MNITNMVKYCDRLTPAENQFADYVLRHREEIIMSTVEDLTKQTFVSKSLIHRFCKKIGLSGFNELKVKLAQEAAMEKSGERIDVNFPFSPQDSQRVIAQKLLGLYEETVADTHKFIDFEELRKVVLALHNARTIDVYTHAHNISIAENFQDKMLSIGRVVNYAESFYKQRRQAMVSDKTHVAIIMSYSGRATFIPNIVKILNGMSIPIIWIGRAGNTEMAGSVKYHLCISDRENFRLRLSQFASHIAMQYVMDLIFSCIFKMSYEENIKFIQNTINIIDDRGI
ncbi:sugar isomerase (sis) [Lucifera butyrica]|uniref:Sugar isomerase (Sis) n=1 Tax=Lucifera butyrica TaxID=1351585 RepID=A0A498REI9_9FIRM|nr:MurR/RpiR family transcriptional regulator [Lucifera butyrica]VBB09357.1 sugar isomerase (sis) [Lucifera butyrica]